ncbi:COG1355, Predicted dioxygenase [uncultured Rubrobacteraceae bacterium]|uniref:COG1355, Predicted dioxygenase n=1 Tax=uncultured Rubrobacteraceae bacterium TaxID=349277 RepID=A0A6J4QIH2_9ACTN|nr:COG1355, Predicted dioxygenase [uncultured Rubrobacteraceae bacterium]
METGTREQTARRRFTVEEYHRMGEAGILREDERVELIEGEIVQMNPIGGRHIRCVNELNWLLGQQLRDRALRVSVQNPIRLNGGLEPQPDLAVIRAGDYAGSLPGPGDALLVIEVSDTTLDYDRNVKLAFYARAGIGEAWIVDLPNEAIERHSDPSEDGYRRMERAGRGRSLTSEVLPNLTLQTDAVLGKD